MWRETQREPVAFRAWHLLYKRARFISLNDHFSSWPIEWRKRQKPFPTEDNSRLYSFSLPETEKNYILKKALNWIISVIDIWKRASLISVNIFVFPIITLVTHHEIKMFLMHVSWFLSIKSQRFIRAFYLNEKKLDGELLLIIILEQFLQVLNCYK